MDDYKNGGISVRRELFDDLYKGFHAPSRGADHDDVVHGLEPPQVGTKGLN